MLPDLKHPTKAALENAMKGYILGQEEFIGRYQRSIKRVDRAEPIPGIPVFVSLLLR